MEKNLVSVSPHISTPIKTSNIMQDVCIALIPAVIAAILIFGFYPLFIIIIAIGSSMLGEYLYNLIMKKQNTLGDWSAVVTGLLLGLNLPPVIPFYVPFVGGLFASMIVKMLFGGLGKNFANPALTARIFLMLCWSGLMTTFVAPIDLSKGIGQLFTYLGGNIDAVTSATPLSYLKVYSNSTGLGNYTILNLFLGNIGGCSGEVSALALILGGVYLAIKRVIDIRIPLIYLSSVVLFTLIFTQKAVLILPHLLSGGLMLGAIFMATDYTTSPKTTVGIIIYSIGLGFLTMIFRVFGKMPEGVSFAILLMNIVTPLLDIYIVPKPFGYVKPVKQKKEIKDAK
jgi:electron transport complex protein RnfD